MSNDVLDFDWLILPENANWIAMDGDYKWWWYWEQPFLEIYTCDRIPIWSKETNDDGDLGVIPELHSPKNFTGYWKDSLFEVPKNKENENILQST